MNEPEYLKAARHLAHNSLADGSLSELERFALLYETITSQLPDADEAADFIKMVKDLERIYGEDPELAKTFCDGVEMHQGVSNAQLAAWTMLVSTIYNLDITKTRG
jgi:hypothetical protein